MIDNDKYKKQRRIINILGIVIGVEFLTACLLIYFL